MRTILILFLCCFLWIGCNESTKVNDDPPKTEQQESIQKQRGWMDAYKIPMILCGLIVIVVIVLIKIYKLPENEGDDSSCSRSNHKYSGGIVVNNEWIENLINTNIKEKFEPYENDINLFKSDNQKLKKLEKEIKDIKDRLNAFEEVKKSEECVTSTKQEENSSQIRYFDIPSFSEKSKKAYFSEVYNDDSWGDVKFEVEITGKMGKYKPIDISRLKGYDDLGVAIFCKEGSCFYSEANSFRIIEEGEVHFEGEKGAGGEEGIWVIDKRVAITLIR